MSKKLKLEQMSFLDASKSDLIDRIICLRANQGKDPQEEELKGLDKEALIIRLLVVEGHVSSDTEVEHYPNAEFPWRNEKLLEVYNRKQGETEHEGKYLETIKNLSIRAGFKEGSKQFESLVTNRFIDGIHDSVLRDKIMSIKKHPSTEDLENICNISGFDLLLRRNVNHIWEKIFLSLDYESFKKCLSVSKGWNNILTSESFVEKAKSTYAAQIWMDTEHLERRVWKSSKNIYSWTTNGKEVAYLEGNRMDNKMIHFINTEGRLTSRDLKLRHIYELWILNHIILLMTRKNVYSVDKSKLQKNKLFSWPDPQIDEGIIKVIPNVGVRFLRIDRSNNHHTFFLKEVSFDHLRMDEWEKDETDKKGCCNTTSAVAPKYDNDCGYPLCFSEDGSHFMYHSRKEIEVFSIDIDGITHLWDDKEQADIDNLEANSQYVVYVSGFDLILRDIRNGNKLETFCISEEKENIRAKIFLSVRQITIFTYWLDDYGNKRTLHMVNLDKTNRISRCDVRREFWTDRYAEDGIIDGQVLIMPTKCNKKFHMLDLTSGGPDEVLGGSRLISTTINFNKNMAGKLNNFVEIKKGLCAFEVDNEEEANFMIETIAWKGEKLPEAMDTWVKWLERAD